MRLRLLMVCLLASAVTGCKCGPGVTRVPSSLGVTPVSFDFTAVKVGTTESTMLMLSAQTKSPVAITSITLANGNAPGGAEAFTLGTRPTSVEALGTATLEVSFAPTAYQAYEAVLTIASDDPDHPTIAVLLSGTGAKPLLTVTPDCAATRKCVGTVVVTPPSIDFGGEPFVRALPVDVSTLPSIIITNDGQVPLKVTRIAIEGTDAAAFTFPGNSTVPATGLDLDPSAGVNLAIRFKPTSELQQSYTADAVIESDDPDHLSVKVTLTGTLRPNLPPVVCVNLIKVQPIDDAERDYSSKAEWATLLVPPAGGYDFTNRRDVEPRSVVILSAISDSADQTACSSDPEDGRIGLAWQWTLLSAPAGAMSLGIAGATTPQATLRPIVTGEYTVQLTVKDTQLHVTSTTIKFAVALKQDLVAQLQWQGFAGVDLDVHLVRPSAVTTPSDPFSGGFAFFEAGTSGKTAGDINGYSAIKQKNTAGFDFDWGNVGTSDDPRLNIDDTGSGDLLENVSLNYPENDARCATAACSYKVMVHYFKDARNAAAPASCIVDGGPSCLDGQACSCGTAGELCVADGAPIGDAGRGVGKCYAAPKPVVRIFLKGSPVAARTIPLDTLVPPDALAIGAPCQMLYVADVVWPAKTAIGSLPDGGTPLATITVQGEGDGGRIIAPVIQRFGYRPIGGNLQCTPDTTKGAGVAWYSEQPN